MNILAGEYGQLGSRERWKKEVLEHFFAFAKRPGCEGCFKNASIETYP